MSSFQIICQTPELAQTLHEGLLRERMQRAINIRIAQVESGWKRYVVIDAGFPRALWLVWDCEAGDNLRGLELGTGKSFRHWPWMTTKGAAQKIADRHNKRVAKEG